MQARAATPDLSLLAFFQSAAAQPLHNALLPVRLSCPSGGLPEDSALLCAPASAAEVARLRARLPAPPADPLDTSLSHNERQARPTAWDVLMERNNKLTHPHPIRATIGFLSHGWFSYQQGMGVGIGFVAAQPFVEMMAMQQQPQQAEAQTDGNAAADENGAVIVWCRNQSGLAYRAAQMQLMPYAH